MKSDRKTAQNGCAKTGFFHSLVRILQEKPGLPESLEDNLCLGMILARRSTRKFLSKPVPEAVIDAIIEAGRLAPSAVNLQSWTFVCFTRREWQDQFNQPLPFNGQYAILVLSDLHRLETTLTAFEFPEAPLVLHTMAVFNAGLAAMAMTLAAEACGVASIMLSETGQTGLLDVGWLCEGLSLPAGVVPLTTLVLGYRRKGLLAMPPKLPVEAICGRRVYPGVDQSTQGVWLADMQAGYRAMRPWTSFKDQVRTYASKIRQAEADLASIINKNIE